jgi:nuclear transport factor 2 (NTF2) superfamily protein
MDWTLRETARLQIKRHINQKGTEQQSTSKKEVKEIPMDVALVPPFTLETALAKVRKVEDGWNSRNPEQVALAYAVDSLWRNRAEFVNGREAIVAFLERKWSHELDYRLIKELWTFGENRLAVRFAYEWLDNMGRWWK